MARTTEITRVVGNRGRAFGSPSKRKSYKRKSSHHASRSNSGGEILAYSLATGNPGARKGKSMATRKQKKSYTKRPGSKRTYKKNRGHARKSYGGVAHLRNTGRRYKRNAGPTGSIGPLVTTGAFAIVGAVGSKLGAQLVLGTNNTGVFGYGGNLLAGAALWFLADKVMKNRGAANGIAIGTVIQVMLRALSDYTPLGSFVANLGMGDYQAQSYVAPQILVDPTNTSEIKIPNGWGGGMISAPATTVKGRGMGSTYDGGGFLDGTTY
jgi:hypothetical protein